MPEKEASMVRWYPAVSLVYLVLCGCLISTADAGTEERTATFRYEGSLRLRRDTAHLGHRLYIGERIRDLNKITSAFVEAEKHNVDLLANNSTLALVNSLRLPVQRAVRKTQYLCDVISCTEKMPTINSPFENYLVEDSIIDRNPTGTVIEGNSLHRHKRQIFGAVLGAVAIGMSIYNKVEIEELKGEVFGLAENQKRVIFALREHAEAIQKNQQLVREIVTRLNDGMDDLDDLRERVKLEEFLMTLREYLADHEEWVDEVIQLLFDKRPSPRFFRRDTLMEGLRDLFAQAKKLRLELASTDFNDILEAPLSYLIEDDTVYMMIHLPLVDAPVHSLYAFVDAPYRTEDGRTVRLQEKTKYLATNDVNSLFTTFTDEMFASCTRGGGSYICYSGVTSKNPDASCLSALYMQHAAVSKLCSFSATEEVRETVTQVAADEVIVTAPTMTKSTVTRVNCWSREKQTSKVIEVEGARRIQVPPGCVLSTDNFSFRAASRSGLHSDYMVREIGRSTLTEAVASVDWTRRRLAHLNATNLPEIHHLETVKTAHHATTARDSALATLAVIVTLVVMLGVGYYVYKKRKLAQSQNESATMAIRFAALREAAQASMAAFGLQQSAEAETVAAHRDNLL